MIKKLAPYTKGYRLLMLFANALVRTQHREFLPKIDKWGRLVVKLRYIGVPVFLVVLVAGFILSNRCPYVYGDTLVDPQIILPKNQACLRLPGIDGKAKMSKSLGNCIYLADDPDDVRTKVMGMYTDPNHLQVSDPGNTKENPVFLYLDAFCTDEHFARYLPDYANLEELKAHYERGGLGDVKVKKFLNNVLQETLEPIRTRRQELAKDPDAIMEILRQGSGVAKEAAAQTLDKVKHAMQIDYFA